MKSGAENKTKLRIAIGLMVVAVIAVAWTLMPSGESTPEVTDAPATSGVPPTKAKTPRAVESIDPRLHLDLLANAENVKYEGRGINIFRAGAEPISFEKPKVPVVIGQQNPGGPGGPANYTPPPPPINLKFFGTTNAKGEKPKAFLSQGDDVWIAREGDVVNRHYKIVRILPNAIEVEDLLNNNRQNIPLSQG